MKKLNCPDCEATSDDSCENCQRVKLTQVTYTFTDYWLDLIKNGAGLFMNDPSWIRNYILANGVSMKGDMNVLRR